jgi:hypothetical protein
MCTYYGTGCEVKNLHTHIAQLSKASTAQTRLNQPRINMGVLKNGGYAKFRF